MRGGGLMREVKLWKSSQGFGNDIDIVMDIGGFWSFVLCGCNGGRKLREAEWHWPSFPLALLVGIIAETKRTQSTTTGNVG